ncbi:MAG: hypothetical protein LQ339_008817 [Xanthoria mediterranea]|nr:MAG: hypothetical protein LQ339_008817 [Xanthoria mediterranea]
MMPPFIDLPCPDIPWNPLGLNSQEIYALLNTLPYGGQDPQDREFFSTRNVLCSFRLDPAHASNWYRSEDLKRTLYHIQVLPQLRPHFAAWEKVPKRKWPNRDARTWIRDTNATVLSKKEGLLTGLDGVTTKEDLKNVDHFPPNSLNLLCAGMHAQMWLPDLEALLTAWHTTAKHQSHQLKPFTGANIERIFNYLRVAGWDEYDDWVVLSPRCRLEAEAEKAEKLQYLERMRNTAFAQFGWKPRIPEAPYTMPWAA